MRIIGIIAVFVLSLVAIGEGAYLFKLSRQIDALSKQVGGAPVADDDPFAASRPRSSAPSARVAAAIGDAGPRPVVPNFVLATPAPSTPAATTLREALATSEGREQLKGALAMIKEEERQDKMLRGVSRDEEREGKWKERIVKGVQLTGDEPLKMEALFTQLNEKRRQILEEMKAGVKSAEQADDEIDNLRDNTEKQVRTLLGDARLKQLKEQEKKEKEERRRAEQQQQIAQGQRQ